MDLADEVLTRLFERGDRAALNQSGRAVQLRLADDLPQYWAISLDARDACHERLRAAQRAGAVELQWSQLGGEDRTVDRVRLGDLMALARFLGRPTTFARVAQAQQQLAPWIGRVSRVREMIERWAHMKSVRSLGPEAAPDLADALRVLDALSAASAEDQIVRRLSVELFRNSKRIEQLDRHLDILTAESLSSSARAREDVFGELGLVKEPQPFLLAGQGVLRLIHDQSCPVAHPYVGVANKVLVGYDGSPQWILTVENLTSFHLCSQLPNAGRGLIIYTAGMPSPSWCRAFGAVLSGIAVHTPAYHWGDIDAGGFRIAAHLRRYVEPGRPYRPWLMLATDLPKGIELEPVQESAAQNMRRHAARAGWLELERALPNLSVEQEAIDPQLPPE